MIIPMKMKISQGKEYTAFCKDIKTPYEVIDYGFDPEKWYSTSEKIPNSFITVASWLENPYRAKLKGVDLILEAANSFPDAHFTIVGFPDNTPLPGNPKKCKNVPLGR